MDAEATRRIILSNYPLAEEQNRRIAARAAELGCTFVPAFEDREKMAAQVDERIAEAEIFLGGRITPEQWRRAERLAWIHVPWAGVNSLFQVAAIRESPIMITNSSGVMSDAVADQVLAYLLMLGRDLPAQLRAQGRGGWERYATESPRRRRLRGMTLGLIGYGAIGFAIAERARAFGMRVIALRRNPGRTATSLDLELGPSELPRLLAESDFVVTAAPLTQETAGLIGAEELRMMKPSAFFINISRGAIVVESALIAALMEGTIAGAALDVFETEPLPEGSPFWSMENVIVTPHSAGGFVGFTGAVTDLFLDNLRRYVQGEPLLNVVRQRRGY